MSRVTAVIPCFNHGAFIDNAVDSVLNQTYTDVEIVIVDDGSTDVYTVDKLRTYRKPRTRVIRTENRGVSCARNAGIHAAAGDYILALDADDQFAPTFLEKAVSILDCTPRIGVVTCWVKSVGVSEWLWRPGGGDVKVFLCLNNCASGALYRRKCWEDAGGYDERYRDGYEDWDFWIMVTSKGWEVFSIQEPLFFYRTALDSKHVNDRQNHVELVRRIVDKHKDIYERHIAYVLCEKEKMLADQRSWISSFEHSPRVRLANALFAPLDWCRAVRKRMGK